MKTFVAVVASRLGRPLSIPTRLHCGPSPRIVLLVAIIGAAGTLGVPGSSIVHPPVVRGAILARGVGLRNLSFEPNRGQAPSGITFLARGEGYTAGLSATGMALTAEAPTGRRLSAQMVLLGANARAAGQGEQRLPGTVEYLSAHESWRSLAGIPTYAALRFRGVYPGIDMLYHNAAGRLEYDFILASGADPRQIQLAFEAATPALDRSGNLELRTSSGVLHQQAPALYQLVHGERRAVSGRYVLTANRAGISVGRYDRRLPLVIDPVLVFSTYYGSSADDIAEAIAVDRQGNIYVAGNSNTPGDKTRIAFISRLDASGKHVLYTKYISNVYGSHSAECNASAAGIAVDREGNAYVTGSYGDTGSADSAICSAEAVLWASIAPGGQIAVKTFGTAGGNQGRAIALDAQGNSYVTGSTDNRPNTFPVTPGAFQTTAGIDRISDAGEAGDAFVLKINPSGHEVYGTFLGGSGIDAGYGIAVDAQGQTYVVGITGIEPINRVLNFPLTRSAFQVRARSLWSIGFLSKLSADGSTLLYSTLLDGNDGEVPRAVAVDGQGDAFVTGETTSTDFPTTRNAYKPWCGTDGACNVAQACHYDQVQATNVCHTGNTEDAFMSVIATNAAGAQSLLYSTYIGGSSRDMGAAIAVDGAERAYIAGRTASHDFPMLHSLTAGGGWDAFVAEIDPRRAGRSSLVFSSYLGGNGADEATGIALGRAGTVYVTGDTNSRTGFPTADAMQATNAGGYDAFITEIGGLNGAA